MYLLKKNKTIQIEKFNNNMNNVDNKNKKAGQNNQKRHF